MPTMAFDIPNELLIAISNKAQADKADFVATAVKLMEIGLQSQIAKPIDPDESQRLIALMVEEARQYAPHTPFTTQDLLSEIEWHSFHADSRKSAGRGFSKAVRDGEVEGVRYTREKTIQNKSIYIREV